MFNANYLGRGWSFPPEFDAQTLGVKMLNGEDDIASSLYILLTTTMGERVLLPEYGCNLEELLFEQIDTRIKTLVADKIESAIIYHEPRIDIESVAVSNSPGLEGSVDITLTYRVKTTNSRFNFVYPFYRTEGTDVNLLYRLTALGDNT